MSGRATRTASATARVWMRRYEAAEAQRVRLLDVARRLRSAYAATTDGHPGELQTLTDTAWLDEEQPDPWKADQ